MNPIVEQAVVAYLAKVNTETHCGKIIKLAEMKEPLARLTIPVPDWYVELLSTYPLAGAELDYPRYEAKDNYDGFEPLELATAKDIYSETEQCYPGVAIRDLGYVCLATDLTGSGDPYFVKVTEGDNPPVYQVYHDVSDIGSVIEREGMVMVAGSLAEFFMKARVVR